MLICYNTNGGYYLRMGGIEIYLADIEMFYAKQLPLRNENTMYMFLSNASET